MNRALLLLAAILPAACDALPAGSAALDAEEARLVAAEIDAAALSLLDTQVGPLPGAGADGLAGAQGAATTAFSGARDCPAGGRVTVAGTVQHAWDTEARTRSAETAAVKTHEACALRGRTGRTLTLDGAPNLALTARRAFRDGAPDGVQTTRAQGAVAYTTSDGRSGTCAVDLASSYDPATRTHRVEGTVCGFRVELSASRHG